MNAPVDKNTAARYVLGGKPAAESGQGAIISEADVKATLDFMNWCVTSEAGTKSMAEDMGFTIPFKTAEAPSNVFVKQDAEYTEAGLTPVSWKNTLGSALTAYAAGSGSWDDVKSAFVDNWATEKALSE